MIPLPNTLLRSVVRCEHADHEPDLAGNLYDLRNEIEPEGIEADIVRYVGYLHERSRQVPTVALVQRHFEKLDAEHDGRGAAGLVRLGDLLSSGEVMLAGAEFRVALNTYKEAVSRELLSALLLDAANILGPGVQRRMLKAGKWEQVQVRGVDDTVAYINETVLELKRRVKQGAIEGNFRDDAETLRQQYEMWKQDPTLRRGVLSGIDYIDKTHHGAKNGELVLIMGFVSHLKTSFCLNWLYKAAIYYGLNVAIVSLETPVDILRTVLNVMHAGHARFEADLGLSTITFEAVRAASLAPDEFTVWNRVVDDFACNADYGQIFYKEPQESITIDEIRTWAEALHAKTPLDLILIDYLGLVDPGKNVSGLEQNSNLNRVIRQAKLMAMTFGHGRGIPVLSPFQANRDGLKEAEKNGGRYKLTALANANEAERSADVVYYVYLDDNLRASSELVMGNLKARNSPLILDQWNVYAEPATRIITNPNPTAKAQQVVAFGED